MTSELESNTSPDAALEAFEITQTNPTSAVLPLRVRLISFLTVCIGGLAGSLCGYAVTDLLSSSEAWQGLSLVVGGLFGAVGIGVVIQLGLKARPEWKASQKPNNSVR